MPTSNPLDLLLLHDAWATRSVLTACLPLTDEQFHRPFEMGPGSLHNTLTHILGSKRSWTELLAGIEPRLRLEKDGQRRGPGELLALLDPITGDFDQAARSHPLDEMVTGKRGDKTYTFVGGAVITHVTTHAMHHRAQCLNMLRHIGVSPLPPSSVLEWMFMVDKQG